MTEPRVILVVEDNEANQMLARAVLELEGYGVEVAGSAPEALEYLASAIPDLILMDIQLPGRDGLSLTQELKANARTADVPIVALTAHAMRGDRELALNAGCAGYIAKPIDVKSFGVQVRGFLRNRADDRRLVTP
jgi:CheY-like chemotaxis protein